LILVQPYQSANSVFLLQQISTGRTYQSRNPRANGLVVIGTLWAMLSWGVVTMAFLPNGQRLENGRAMKPLPPINLAAVTVLNKHCRNVLQNKVNDFCRNHDFC